MGTGLRRPQVVIFVAACLGVLSLGAEWTSMKTPLGERGFEKIEIQDGVTVYRYPSKGMVRLAAEGEFSYPPDQVQKVLLDFPGQVGRIGRIAEAKVLNGSPEKLFVYQRIDMPLISDRDYNLVVRWGQSGQLRWVRFHAVADGGRGVRQRVVRVVDHVGSWQLLPVADGTATFARFQFRIDLGGGVPPWLARSAASDDVARVFVEFRKMLAEM